MRPSWAHTAIWWSIYPLGACGAPIHTGDEPGIHHRLGRLEAWLDHLIELGLNGLALGPIWASRTHGYDILDHTMIDPRLGDIEDFDRLIQACKTRGIRVLLDGVFNHLAWQHARVQQALADGAQSDAATIFRKDPLSSDGLSRFEGHGSLVELDHSCDEVVAYVVNIMNYWLDRGADGWRLDAAYRIPAEFWAKVLPQVRARHPQALIVAEILQEDPEQTWAEADFDSITQYELWKALWSSLNDRNPHELLWALQRHEDIQKTQLPWTFVSNHDVTRIATHIGPWATRVAIASLMTLPGMPALYYGDEWGMSGLKLDREGGDDDIRPELRETPGPWEADQAESIRLARLAVHIRRTHPWLVDGTLQVLECSGSHVVWRTTSHEEAWVQAELDFDEPWLRVSDSFGEIAQFHGLPPA